MTWQSCLPALPYSSNSYLLYFFFFFSLVDQFSALLFFLFFFSFSFLVNASSSSSSSRFYPPFFLKKKNRRFMQCSSDEGNRPRREIRGRSSSRSAPLRATLSLFCPPLLLIGRLLTGLLFLLLISFVFLVCFFF